MTMRSPISQEQMNDIFYQIYIENGHPESYARELAYSVRPCYTVIHLGKILVWRGMGQNPLQALNSYRNQPDMTIKQWDCPSGNPTAEQQAEIDEYTKDLKKQHY